MSIEGSLGDFRLQEILQAVAQQRRTGILTLQSETTIVAVSFLAGGVVSADSLAHTVEERLGDALSAEGLLDRDAVSELTRRQDEGEGRLVDLLVSDGLLSRDEVLGALRRQNHALLLELLDWQEGEFKFYGGDEVAYEEGIEPIAIDEFLLANLGAGDGVTTADDEAAIDGWSELADDGAADDGTQTSQPTDEAPAASAPAGWGSGPVRPFGDPLPQPVEPAGAVAVSPVTDSDDAAEPLRSPVVPAVVRRPPVARLQRSAGHLPGAGPVPSLLGLLLAAVLVVGALIAPANVLVPFPWQDGERRALFEVQRLADRLAVDRAAKTFFLLEGRFPDRLDELVELGLLDRDAHFGPDGRRLELVAGAESYDILAVGDDQPLWSEAISGNFLLDPELRSAVAASSASLDAPPLVLLD